MAPMRLRFRKAWSQRLNSYHSQVPQTGWIRQPELRKADSTVLPTPSIPVSHWEEEAEWGLSPSVERIRRSPLFLLSTVTCWPQFGQPRHLPIQRPPTSPLTKNKVSFPFSQWVIQVDNISIRNHYTPFCWNKY